MPWHRGVGATAIFLAKHTTVPPDSQGSERGRPPAATSFDEVMRSMARELGVSEAIVLLALRNDERISPTLRAFVRQMAEEAGCDLPAPVPNPAGRAVKISGATIAGITTHVEVCEPYGARLFRLGAQRAAERLGYQFEVHRTSFGRRRGARLEELLQQAKTIGIIILPLAGSVGLTRFLDWSAYSIISGAECVVAPTFDRAEPDHFDSAMQICEKFVAAKWKTFALLARGPGAAARVMDFSGAAGSMNTIARRELLTLEVVPEVDGLAGLRRWFDKTRPRAIVCENDQDVELVSEQLGTGRTREMAFVVTNHFGMPGWSGMDRRYGAIGEAAVWHLDAAIHAGRKGVPVHPQMVTVRGSWVEAATPATPAPTRPRTRSTLRQRAGPGRQRTVDAR